VIRIFCSQSFWRKLEEIIAGEYEQAGWSVILTPRSGDHGRDIVATYSGLVSIRILDQVKAYKRGHLIKADEVRAPLGALAQHPNTSKGLITTTSRFAPGIEKEPGIMQFVPHRLELRNGDSLLKLLTGLRQKDKMDSSQS
jgi:restriction system protein